MNQSEITENAPPGAGSGIALTVTVRDAEGNIIDEKCKNGDLFLRNWGYVIAGLLKYGFNYTGVKDYFYNLPDGTVYKVPDTLYWCAGQSYWLNTGRIVLGGSSQAPSVLDYKLGNQLKEVVPNLPALVTDGNIIKIIFTGTASFEVETIVSEVGIKMNNPCVIGGTAIFLTRDTFEAVTVSAGGTITVQFEMWFNGVPT
ncbi:hypothetical protein FGU65_09310 [Methanoculleus sp. FWC-SCC1]|uniref:Phage tail protein n=1 Tax=Methanoculleus frigidifontis TaxID=2584085 RepID=A0ABT8MAY1_9EURY|nr:hypothetical protein [Methanoculleus sp. FWC-SCC1]MDN7025082.1 hypothetical protein [Methanoculleus sp. FWC-SCC1]